MSCACFCDVGGGRFLIQPGYCIGRGTTHGSHDACRGEMRFVASFCDRQCCAFREGCLYFQIGRIEAVIVREVEPARLIGDSKLGTVRACLEGFDVAAHATPPVGAPSDFRGSRMILPSNSVRSSCTVKPSLHLCGQAAPMRIRYA